MSRKMATAGGRGDGAEEEWHARIARWVTSGVEQKFPWEACGTRLRGPKPRGGLQFSTATVMARDGCNSSQQSRRRRRGAARCLTAHTAMGPVQMGGRNARARAQGGDNGETGRFVASDERRLVVTIT